MKNWIFISVVFSAMLIVAFTSIPDTSQHKGNDGWPKASKYIEGIPLYDKFEDMEALFHFENDTTYIINFWATWCKPCLEELPFFEEYRDKNADEKVRVILISLDFPRHIESKLLPYLEKEQLKSTILVLLDGSYNDWIDKISSDWSGAIPATYMYQKEKKHFISDPFKSLKELEDAVRTVL